MRCPETWQEATEHVTLRWRPLLPETPVVTEIEQRPLEGARKESLFSVEIFHAPPRGGGTPLGSCARKPQDLFLEEMMLQVKDAEMKRGFWFNEVFTKISSLSSCLVILMLQIAIKHLKMPLFVCFLKFSVCLLTT